MLRDGETDKKKKKDAVLCQTLTEPIILIDKYAVLHEIRQDSQLTCHVCHQTKVTTIIENKL